MRILALAISAVAVAGQPAFAQHQHEGAGLAPATALANAQDPFDRGLYLLHNFEYERARAAFRAAQAADPSAVMAYWGEAMTYNHPLWMEIDIDQARAALARLGPTPTDRLAKARTARERGFLGAVEALYGAGGRVERDTAYNRRMEAMFEADPQDIDIRTFTALSIMGLAHDGRDTALYMRAASILEEIYPAHQKHPGVLHYLIHAYDDPAHAPLGLRAARRYGEVAPDAGHALHMTSHIYLALGQWRDVERANVSAMKTVNEQRVAAQRPAMACGHYYEWLVYALLQQGRDPRETVESCAREAAAEQSAYRGGKTLGPYRSAVNSWADMATRVAVETGAAPATVAPEQSNYPRARFWLAYGRMIAADSDPAKVDEERSAMELLHRASVTAEVVEEPDDRTPALWRERALAQGAALSALAKGRTDDGVDLLRRANAAERALPVEFGPPALPKPSAELLGEKLLALGRKAEAAAAFRQALADAPGRRRSLGGLKLAGSE